MRRIALALCAAAVVVPAAQASTRPDNRAVGPRTQATQQDFWNYDATGKKIADSSPGVAPNELAQQFSGQSGAIRVPEGFGNNASLIQRHNALAKLPDDSDVASFYTPAQIKAMGDRYNAEAALFAPLPAHVQDLTAMNDRYQEQGPLRVVVVSPDTFDWSNAGIGALSAFGALFLAGLTLVAMRRQRRLAL